jgi:thioesterase domain-containing protein
MADRLPSAKIEVLISSWQRVLQHVPIVTDDDFFDLGGNASLAAKLFAEIAQEFGQNLHPATICRAPTIAALATLLATPQAHAPLVLLKPGAEGPPVFMTHGIGSSVIDLVPLARRMQLSQPIYGMEARGNDSREEPLDCVEDMAQFFLDPIRQLQPRGPYFLIGYSLGGLVTLEMAQRLSAAGDKVALLAMLDSYPDRHQLSFGQHARLALRLAKQRVTSRMRGSGHLHRSGVGKDGGANASDQPQFDESTARALQRMKDSQYRALRSYRPRFYDGRVKFVRAAISSYFPEDPVAVWAHLVRDLEVETVPGDHVEMLTTQVETLALVVRHYIEEAPGGK